MALKTLIYQNAIRIKTKLLSTVSTLRNYSYSAGFRCIWLMDESTGAVTDSTNNGYNSSSVGAGITVVAGKFGNARNFAGNSGTNTISFGSSAVLPQNLPFSISVWINPASIPTTGYFVPIRLYQTGGQWLSVLSRVGGLAGGQLILTNAFRNSVQNYYPVAMSAGQWYHIVFTYSGGSKASASSYQTYLNGTSITSTGNQGVMGGTANDSAIGTDGGDAAGMFAGIMDSVIIYDHVLTQSEISYLYTNPY